MYVEKELKKEIIQIKDFLLSLVAALPAGIMALDFKGMVIAANQEALNLLGKQERRASEIIDKDISFVIAGLPDLEKKLQECIRHRRSEIFIPELRIAKEGNDVFLAVIGKPISQGMLIFLEDITRIKAVERMEADFVSIASHQLRTPLVGVQWVVERFLKKEKQLSEKGKEYLKDIHTSCQRLSNLVDLLLNVSRIESGEVSISPKQLNLVEFIERFLDEYSPLYAKKNITLIFKKHPQMLKAVTDSNALRNIIQTLISNTIEYTPDGGKVEVSLEKKPSTGSGQDTFLFAVSDTGIGIPEKDQPTIFNKFARGSNAKLIKTDGTGFGLYFAKKATDLLQGKIWFKSKENEGTTFYVELPLEAKSKKGSKDLV